MTLKLAVTAEAEPADDADDRCGICLKTRGHGAHAEEHEFARVLQDRPDNFLALDAEPIDTLSKIRSGCLRGGLFAFHHARGLLNSSRVSTKVRYHQRTEQVDHAKFIFSTRPLWSRVRVRSPAGGMASWRGVSGRVARWSVAVRADAWPGNWGSPFHFLRPRLLRNCRCGSLRGSCAFLLASVS